MKITDTKGLAEILKVNPETVRRMVAAGRIPVIKLGNRDFRFDVEKVIATLGGDVCAN